MQRTIGILLLVAAVIVTVVALALFGPPTKILPSPPPRTVGNTTSVVVSLESTPSSYFVFPVGALVCTGVVLIVWPRPKRQ
jgi:hypothetical protein